MHVSTNESLSAAAAVKEDMSVGYATRHLFSSEQYALKWSQIILNLLIPTDGYKEEYIFDLTALF